METNSTAGGELTVIASEIKITGIVEVRNELHLYGQILGELNGLPGSLIYLKEGCLVEGKITAETVVVEGFAKGKIQASHRVWVTAQGRVVGEVQTPHLQVDPGAIFEAKVEMR